MTPKVSERARLMPASPIRKLMPLADEARRRGVHIYHLNIGQPDLETPEPMRARLRTLEDKVLAYTPSGGTPEYLLTLQAYYRGLGISLDLQDIIATTGGSEALLFALLACASEGDEALVVEPFYTNYSAFAVMAGVRLVPLRARAEDGFHLPPRTAWAAKSSLASRDTPSRRSRARGSALGRWLPPPRAGSPPALSTWRAPQEGTSGWCGWIPLRYTGFPITCTIASYRRAGGTASRACPTAFARWRRRVPRTTSR